MGYYTGMTGRGYYDSKKFRIEFENNKFKEQRMVATDIENLLEKGLISFQKTAPKATKQLNELIEKWIGFEKSHLKQEGDDAMNADIADNVFGFDYYDDDNADDDEYYDEYGEEDEQYDALLLRLAKRLGYI